MSRGNRDRPELAITQTSNYATFLSQCAPFSLLKEKEDVLQLLQSQMQVRQFAAGQYLMRQGEHGSSLMVLQDGVVEVFTEDGGQKHSIARQGRGQVLGEMALLTEEPRTAFVQAQTAVKALVLPAETFHRVAIQHPTISVVLSHLVSWRLGCEGRDVLAGKTLGGYTIRRRLGRGGMAVVYEAFDPEHQGPVALKMMSHRLVYDASALERFQREADIIQSFGHPDIVRMYGRFSAFHTYFIVMEYCEGNSLDEVSHAHGPLPADETRKILARIALALHFAHEARVVHRDVKPSNVMLLNDGSVKLMDFGLATPVEEADPDRTGQLVGTPRYMAPEQLLRKEAGRASDLFALGCVGYELLMGKPLFPQTSIIALMKQHLGWQPPNMKQVAPHAGHELCELIESCLMAAPEDRRLDIAQLASWSAPADVGLLLSDRQSPTNSGDIDETLVQ